MTYQTTIIAAVLALVVTMAGVIMGLGISGRIDSNSTPLLVTVFGTAASTIAALLSLLRTDRAVQEVKKTNGDVLHLTNRMSESEARETPAIHTVPRSPDA